LSICVASSNSLSVEVDIFPNPTRGND
jgi:hypothetical protein